MMFKCTGKKILSCLYMCFNFLFSVWSVRHHCSIRTRTQTRKVKKHFFILNFFLLPGFHIALPILIIPKYLRSLREKNRPKNYTHTRFSRTEKLWWVINHKTIYLCRQTFLATSYPGSFLLLENNITFFLYVAIFLNSVCLIM